MSAKTNTQQLLGGLVGLPDVVKPAPQNAVPVGEMDGLEGVRKRKRYRKNLEGIKFGRLTVIRYDSQSKNGSSLWNRINLGWGDAEAVLTPVLSQAEQALRRRKSKDFLLGLTEKH